MADFSFQIDHPSIVFLITYLWYQNPQSLIAK